MREHFEGRRELAQSQRAGAIDAARVAALRTQGVRVHAVEPCFGPEFGIWINGLLVTLDTTPPRPVVQCIRGASATDPDADVRGRYVATDDADAARVFNACLSNWTRAFPIECTLRGQRTGAHSRPAREIHRPQRRAA